MFNLFWCCFRIPLWGRWKIPEVPRGSSRRKRCEVSLILEDIFHELGTHSHGSWRHLCHIWPDLPGVMSAGDEPAGRVSKSSIQSQPTRSVSGCTSSPWCRGVRVFSGLWPNCYLLMWLTYYMAVRLCAPSCIGLSKITLASPQVSGWGCWPGLPFIRLAVFRPWCWILRQDDLPTCQPFVLVYYFGIWSSISFLKMEYWNQTLQYYLPARGIFHSTLPREYTD